MQKENNCGCVVCQVERSLLDSLSTQTARTHFQALARNHSILNHFDSPADVIAQLHEHERTEAVNHKAWNGILHALVDSIADRTFEEIGQQLLLLAYMPAIHKVYREACQKFPGHRNHAQVPAVHGQPTGQAQPHQRPAGVRRRAGVSAACPGGIPGPRPAAVRWLGG